MNSIPKQVFAGLGQVVTETVEKTGEEIVKAVDSVISGSDLVADAKPMGAGEYQQKVRDDDKVRGEEMANIRSQIPGRQVEKEMEEVRKAKKEEEEQKEKEFLENLRRQREAERAEMASLGVMESGNPAKRKKKRGSAFAKGGKSKPSQSDMSATGEFKGKVD